MQILFYISVTIVVLAVLFVIIVVHEWGHYKTAKMFGIRVDEFGFGYPPRIMKLFKRGETVFTLNALPFGGFVKIYGEDDVKDGGDISRALFNKPKWQQAIVMVAGVVMNIVLAWVIFLFLFVSQSPAIQGHLDSKYISDNQITVSEVLDNSVASTAGLLPGDMIVSVTDNIGSKHRVIDSNDFINFIRNSNGKSIDIGIERNGFAQNIIVSPTQSKENNVYTVGLSLTEKSTINLPFIDAVKYSFITPYEMTRDIFAGFGNLFKGLFGVKQKVHTEVAGPVGIIRIIRDAMMHGKDYVLYLTAFISINLGALNILPIPALDGGRLLFIVIEKIKGKQINIKTATIVHSVSFFILVSLMLLVTFLDVVKLFK